MNTVPKRGDLDIVRSSTTNEWGARVTIEPIRPALRYFGSKALLASKIVSYFPKHKSYLEPFGGGASVLLNKPRSIIETYNDLDLEVVNFFRVLRQNPDEMVAQIELTPYSRTEFEESFEPTDDPVERARRFFIRTWMSIGGHNANNKPSHFRYIKSFRSRVGKSPAGYWVMHHLHQIAERLMGVQIENRDAFYLITHFDTPETLHYLDPPYVHSTRTRKDHKYNFELSDSEHEKLAGIANELKGFCVISGYPSELYADLYELRGWHRVDMNARANTTSPTSTVRTECLWLSPCTVGALQRQVLL